MTETIKPDPLWYSKPCTAAQRQLLDLIIRPQLRLSYLDLLKFCTDVCNRRITDLTNLTRKEAVTIIDQLKAKNGIV